MGDELIKRLRASNRLPSPPGVALRILELARSDDASLDDMANAISTDPALAGRLLKFVNSPSAGVGRSITTLNEAVNQLGHRGVTLMALSFSLVSSGRMEACASFSFDRFWSRSLACAVAAKHFATHAKRLDSNESFIMGLLLHIGQLAMACAIPESYEAVLQAAANRPAELLSIEHDQIGASHIEAGARLLQEWKLPEGIWQTIIQSQEDPPSRSANGRVASARVLCIADVAATLLCDAKEARRSAVDEILRLVQESFEMDAAGWSNFYDELVKDWKAYGKLLSVKAGTDKSFRELQEEAREQIATLSVVTQLENIGIREQNAQLKQQTRIDGLTGVANRIAFDERLASELERARRTQRPLVLCMLDVDHFKQFNDNHGHQGGDRVLQAVAKVLDDTVRKMDFVARYGGEEFAVIAPECAPSSIASLAERLRASVEELKLERNGALLRVTISIGVAFTRWPDRPRTAEELIQTADARLYEATRTGRNCCRFEEALPQAA